MGKAQSYPPPIGLPMPNGEVTSIASSLEDMLHDSGRSTKPIDPSVEANRSLAPEAWWSRIQNETYIKSNPYTSGQLMLEQYCIGRVAPIATIDNFSRFALSEADIATIIGVLDKRNTETNGLIEMRLQAVVIADCLKGGALGLTLSDDGCIIINPSILSGYDGDAKRSLTLEHVVEHEVEHVLTWADLDSLRRIFAKHFGATIFRSGVVGSPTYTPATPYGERNFAEDIAESRALRSVDPFKLKPPHAQLNDKLSEHYRTLTEGTPPTLGSIQCVKMSKPLYPIIPKESARVAA